MVWRSAGAGSRIAAEGESGRSTAGRTAEEIPTAIITGRGSRHLPGLKPHAVRSSEEGWLDDAERRRIGGEAVRLGHVRTPTTDPSESTASASSRNRRRVTERPEPGNSRARCPGALTPAVPAIATEQTRRRDSDCNIELLPGFMAPRGRAFSLSMPETQAMTKYTQEELANAFIHKSSSPAGAGFFIVNKKEGAPSLY